MNELDKLYRGIREYQDEIQHYGNRNSGRYPRGSGKNPHSTSGGGRKGGEPVKPGHSYSGNATHMAIKFWGRVHDLPIIRENYPGEKTTQGQADALDNLLGVGRHKNSGGFNSNKAFDEVKKYCKSLDQTGDITKSENAHTYVKPTGIYVSKTEKTAIMCDTKVDPEHGLAIVFNKKGNFEQVGPQDIIL